MSNAQCNVYLCTCIAQLVSRSGRLLPNGSSTTGNNCQCHSACKDDNDDAGGGDGEIRMMWRVIGEKGQVETGLQNICQDI